MDYTIIGLLMFIALSFGILIYVNRKEMKEVRKLKEELEEKFEIRKYYHIH